MRKWHHAILCFGFSTRLPSHALLIYSTGYPKKTATRRRNRIPLFYFSLQSSSRALWIGQGRALRVSWKNHPRCACGIFPESLAQSGTERLGRQEIKYRLDEPQMSNSKTKDMGRSNFTPMGRFNEIIDRYGLKLMEVCSPVHINRPHYFKLTKSLYSR